MRECVVISAGAPESGATLLDYVDGITAESAGATSLCLQLLRVSPAARAAAHMHEGHESAAYVLQGEVVTWFGERLESHVTARAGDFVFVPAGVPHLPVNYGDEEAVAVLARSDPRSDESLVRLPELDDLPHLASPPA